MFRHLICALASALLLSLPLAAQDDYVAQTAAAEVELEVLDLQLRPLRLAELEVEAEAWVALLAAKNAEISAKRIEQRSAEGELRTTLTNEISALSDERTRITDRVNRVLAAITERGGDVDAHEKYIAASTGLEIDAEDLSAAWVFVTNWLTSEEGGIRVGMNIVKFLFTLLAFSILARILSSIVKRALSRMSRTSELLRDFFVNTVRKLTFFIGIIMALSMLEVNIGPFVAAIGAAGFVIGFALQGTLSNFAAGIMILVYRPYDIGQVVTVAGTTGKVDEMTLVSTTLRLPDNQTVVVPNNAIWGDVITNVTGQTTRRVDMVFGCGYGDDLQKAQQVLEDLVAKHPKVLAEPAPIVKVSELADSSVNFVVRPWANTADYWDVKWDLTRQVKDRFDAEDLSIPFPQRDVHLHQVAAD